MKMVLRLYIILIFSGENYTSGIKRITIKNLVSMSEEVIQCNLDKNLTNQILRTEDLSYIHFEEYICPILLDTAFKN